MPRVGGTRFKDLCLDAVDVDAAAQFWSRVLGLRIERRGDLARLTDGVDEHDLWINPVPEPRVVKQWVHLDVHVAKVADLLALGATVLDDSRPWTVLADPEGGELCAFVREPDALPDYRLYEVVVDAVDPAEIAGWWADRLGVAVQHDLDAGYSWVEGAPGMDAPVVFTPVPEAKTVKNRVHWDVWGDPAELVAAGARLLRSPDHDISWSVLADPEGNEFDVFSRP